MGVPAYMLSVLNRQYLLLETGFVRRYPWDWLVWEPGPWKPARTELESNLASTLMPSSTTPVKPKVLDAICFQLVPPPSGQLKLGRATSNDVVINDLTASREQLVLSHRDGAWSLPVSRGQVVIDECERPDGDVALRSGMSLRLGDVRLTYLSSAAMLERARDFSPRR